MRLKLINPVFAVLFFVAALVQHNDPDPYLWMPLYLVALACTIAFQRGRLHYKFGFGVVAACVLWSLTLLPTVVQHPAPLNEVFANVKMYASGVEEAREMGGLWLVAGWLATISNAQRRSRSGARNG